MLTVVYAANVARPARRAPGWPAGARAAAGTRSVVAPSVCILVRSIRLDGEKKLSGGQPKIHKLIGSSQNAEVSRFLVTAGAHVKHRCEKQVDSIHNGPEQVAEDAETERAPVLHHGP